MKKILLPALLSLTVFNSDAQPWVQKIDLGGDDYGNVAVVGDDGSQYIVGSTTATGGGGYDAFVSKLDTEGATVWTIQFGNSGAEYGAHIIKTSDGNLLLVGRSNSGLSSQDVYAVKLDTDGNELWANTYGTDSADFGLRVVEGTDGYLIIGQTRFAENNRSSALLIKIQSDGTLDWAKAFGSQYGNEVAYDAVAMEDAFLIAGYTGINHIGAGMNDGIFFVVDGNTGNYQAIFELGGSGDDDIRLIVPGNDEVYFVGQTRSFGTNNQDIFVAKYIFENEMPVFRWFKTYGGAQSESVTSAKFMGTDKLIITGLTSSFGQGGDGLAMLLDTTGTVLLAKHIGGDGNDVIMDAMGNGATLLGYTNSFGGDNDILLVAPGDGGVFACLADDAAITAVEQTVITADNSSIPADFAITDLTIAVNRNTIAYAQTATDSLVCNEDTGTGIDDVLNNTNMTIYPNPANTDITLEFVATETMSATLLITDVRGEIVKNISTETIIGKNTLNITVYDLSEGLYIVKLKNGEKETFSKFVVYKQK